MGVTCQIPRRNPNDFYRAGDSVKGAVKYVIDEPTELSNVTVSLRSKELCYWEPITSKTKYIETENFVDQRIDLLHAGEREIVTLLPGTYEGQFSYVLSRFVLPEEIPSS